MKRMTIKGQLVAAVAALVLAAPLAAVAAGADYVLTIKDHKFEPATIEIPANTKVKLVVKNLDATPEEFESHDLRREKVVPGKSQVNIYVGPLKPGTYAFEGEYHADTAKGQIVVK